MFTFQPKFLLLTSTLALTASAHYELKQDYSGQNFFQNFDFYNGPDPTNGHVKYIGDATANISGLAGIVHYSKTTDPSDIVFLGVDNATVLPIDKGRKSLRMESVQTFNQSLVIADILHQPANVCGVWPAFWMLGTSAAWPAAGEIDILEGVNDMNFSRMSLHTTNGLSVGGQDNMMSGNMTASNCDVAALNQDKNVGCMVNDSPSTNSYGTAFNQMQGGVFAMEYTTDAIKIWFFNRTRIPDDVAAGKPTPPSKNGSDIHAWGKPTALFQHDLQSSLTTHLRDLQIIFDTTFCGDWAGKVWNQSSCASLAPTCQEYVSKNPRAFDETYWLIKSLRVYEKDESTFNFSSTSNGTHNHSHKNVSRRSLPAGLVSPGSGSGSKPNPKAEDLNLINTWLKSNTKKSHPKTKPNSTPTPSIHDTKSTHLSKRSPEPAVVDQAQISNLFASYDKAHPLPASASPLLPSSIDWNSKLPIPTSTWQPQTHCETDTKHKKTKCTTQTTETTATFPTFLTGEPAPTYDKATARDAFGKTNLW